VVARPAPVEQAPPVAEPPAVEGAEQGEDEGEEQGGGDGKDDREQEPQEPPEPPRAASAEPVEFSRLTGKLGKDRCGVEIKTRPDGAEVFIGDTRLGATPLKVVLPCGEHGLDLRRARYTRVTKSIALEQGTLDKLELNLSRPEHRLRITSAPSGAEVTVNGRAAGTTPATVTVNGFEQARVSVSLAGHKTWSTRIYVRDPTTSVSAKLSADKAEAPAKSAARPGKRSK